MTKEEWIIILSEKIKNRGISNHNWINLRDLTLSISPKELYLYNKDKGSAYVSINEKEYNILNEAVQFCSQRTKDNLINMVINI